jgi:hypothetical protein
VRRGPALAALALVACASDPDRIGDAENRRLEADARAALAGLETEAPPPERELRVRLAFPDGDLDLYVTNAHSETIYFWNTPAATGGQLERDVRCEDAAPRVETVRIPDAPPGRYRVAVDYPRRCEDRSRVGFAVVLEHGARRERARGEIGPSEWLASVLEFELSE